MPQQVLGRPRLRDDLEARLLEQARDTLAEEDRVVREDDAPRVSELRDGAPERREVAREAVGDHLVDPLGVGQALQAVRAEVARLDTRHEGSRRRGEQDLPAVAGGGDAGGADDVEPRVALVAELRDAGVEPHPHLDDDPVRPRVVTDPLPGPPAPP